MGTTAAPAASWVERTLLSLSAAAVVLLLVEAAIAGVLVALTLGLGGTGLLLVGLGATLLGFVGWGVAGLAAALVALAAVRADRVPGLTDLAAGGAALLLVGVAGTIANPASGMIVGGNVFDPRPLVPFQAGIGVVALTAGTLGTALVAYAFGGDRLRTAAFAALHLLAGALTVVGLPGAADLGPLVGAGVAAVAQGVLLVVLAPLWPKAGATGSRGAVPTPIPDAEE